MSKHVAKQGPLGTKAADLAIAAGHAVHDIPSIFVLSEEDNTCRAVLLTQRTASWNDVGVGMMSCLAAQREGVNFETYLVGGLITCVRGINDLK